MSATYNTLQVEAALCVWEAMLETRQSRAVMDFLWDGVGTSQMRHHAISIGVWAEQVFVRAKADHGANVFDAIAYDWEFIPAALLLVTFNATNREGVHMPDIKQAADKLAAQFRNRT